MGDLEISPYDLQNLLKKDSSVCLIDVRTESERAIASIPNSILYTKEVEEETLSWPKEKILICYCHHGVRSLAATKRFRMRGFTHAYSLTGGIEDWSLLINPTIPRY